MDVFGRQDQLLLGGLSSDSMFMTWPDLASVGGGLGMLIQRVSIDYQQPIRRIFEIGPGVVPLAGFPATDFSSLVSGDFCDDPTLEIAVDCSQRTQPTYYIVGRPEGTLSSQHFVGPQALGQCFYRKYGSPCGPNIITISGRAGCNANNAANNPYLTWQLNGVVVNRLTMDVTGQEMVIEEGFSAMVAGINLFINGQDLDCSGTTTTGSTLTSVQSPGDALSSGAATSPAFQ